MKPTPNSLPEPPAGGESAASPVRVDVTKDGIRIRYTAQNHLNFDQMLTPVSATEVHDTIRVSRFGIVVAHFDETIRKLD